MRIIPGEKLLKLSKAVARRSVLVSNSSHLATSAAAVEYDQVQDVAWSDARPYSAIPGPSKWEMFKMFRPGGTLDGADQLEMIDELHRRYGTVFKLQGVAGRPDAVFVTEAEDFEKIFRTEGKMPIRYFLESMGYYREVHRRDVYGATLGLAAEQGQGWWDLRKKVNPVMAKPQATKVYVPKMDEISTDLVNKIGATKDSQNRLTDDFLPLLNKWALESVCYVSMDIRIGLLEDTPDPKAEEFLRNLKLIFEHLFRLDIQPSLWKYFKTPLFRAAMKNNDKLVEGALYFLNRGKAALEERKRTNTMNTEDDKGTLAKLMEIDENYALIMTMDSLIAGVDSTSVVFFTLLLNLARHPEKQELLRQEIMQILPNEDSKLTPENMREMPYLRACMKESLRYTPIAENVRTTGEDLVLQGYQVPKNTNMVMANHIQLKNNAHFPRANEFLPERFLRATDQAIAAGCPNAKTANPFINLPFGFGPRMCIGRRFAELEIETLISRMLRNFRIEWNGPPPTYNNSVGRIPKGKTHFVFNPV